MVVVCARLLQTSMASAVADGDPEATAAGYRFLFWEPSHKGKKCGSNISGILMNNCC